jgi:hypothetical protein
LFLVPSKGIHHFRPSLRLLMHTAPKTCPPCMSLQFIKKGLNLRFFLCLLILLCLCSYTARRHGYLVLFQFIETVYSTSALSCVCSCTCPCTQPPKHVCLASLSTLQQ